MAKVILQSGDNGAQAYYEDGPGDTILIKNHAGPATQNWICISLQGSQAPVDKVLQKRAKPGNWFPLQAKTPTALVSRIKRQYGLDFKLAS